MAEGNVVEKDERCPRGHRRYSWGDLDGDCSKCQDAHRIEWSKAREVERLELVARDVKRGEEYNGIAGKHFVEYAAHTQKWAEQAQKQTAAMERQNELLARIAAALEKAAG